MGRKISEFEVDVFKQKNSANVKLKLLDSYPRFFARGKFKCLQLIWIHKLVQN